MTLDILALKAKKSLSGLFSSYEPKHTATNGQNKASQNENATPEPQRPGPFHPGPASTRPDVTTSSPSKASPSRGKALMGSLRKKSLRSIDSLRNLRSSPSKSPQPEQPITLPISTEARIGKAPLTPKANIVSSLVLNFEEPPVGKPIIDLSRPRTDSPVQHSSPVAVPPSTKRNDLFSTPVDSSVMPAGTVPNSPTPLQKALDADRTKDSPSPASKSSSDLDAMRRPLPTPMPGANFSFEEAKFEDVVLPEKIRRAAELLDVPTHEPDGTPIDAECVESMVKTCARAERQKAIDGMTAWLHCPHPPTVAHPSKGARKGLFESSDESAKDPETYALSILCCDYHVRIYRRADGKRRMKFLPVKLEYEPKDFQMVIWARREQDFIAAEKIASQLGTFVKEKGTMLADCVLDLEEALEAGLVPFFLDMDLEWDITKPMRSRMLVSEKSQPQDGMSTWGRHSGLYDGTGYGVASDACASRPATSHGGEEPAKRPEGLKNPSAVIDTDEEISETFSQLWNGTDGWNDSKAVTPEPCASAAGDGNETQDERDTSWNVPINQSCCACCCAVHSEEAPRTS